jgi:hypothetical protein
MFQFHKGNGLRSKKDFSFPEFLEIGERFRGLGVIRFRGLGVALKMC